MMGWIGGGYSLPSPTHLPPPFSHFPPYVASIFIHPIVSQLPAPISRLPAPILSSPRTTPMQHPDLCFTYGFLFVPV